MMDMMMFVFQQFYILEIVPFILGVTVAITAFGFLISKVFRR